MTALSDRLGATPSPGDRLSEVMGISVAPDSSDTAPRKPARRVAYLRVGVALALWGAFMASILAGAFVWILAEQVLTGAVRWCANAVALGPLACVAVASGLLLLLSREYNAAGAEQKPKGGGGTG